MTMSVVLISKMVETRIPWRRVLEKLIVTQLAKKLPNVQCLLHKNPLMVHILGQTNPVHITTPLFIYDYFDTIFPSAPRSPT
jgi:hypothetical protein